MTPYYADDMITLYHGDCREATEWLTADVLVTDPPYGRDWRQGQLKRSKSASRDGIAGDTDTTVRDAGLALWGNRPAIMFGDSMLAPPHNTKQVLFYRKPADAGVRGATAGFRRDVELIYLLGPWPSGIGGYSSLLTTGASMVGGVAGPSGRYGHPHAKPVDLMEELVAVCAEGVVADPFAGGGSTLIAARNQGRRAIGVELDERYCEAIVKRLNQNVLPLKACP